MCAAAGFLVMSYSGSRIWWMPPDGSLHGPAADHLMWLNLVGLGLLFLLSQVLLAYSLFRRNQQNFCSPEREKTELKDLHFFSRAEILFWKYELFPLIALTILYTGLAIAAQRLWAANRFQGASPQALQVEVTGVQFQWYFRYPGQDAAFGATRPDLVNAPAGNPLGLDPTDPHGKDDIVSSTLVLPAGREVDLGIRSFDVIHGFFIPGMRVKQNAVPGMEMHIHFTPTVPGDYPILCSQVCGLGHARMQAHLRVVPEREYEKWLAAHLPKESR
jgi:cytochrome c oxidase subunit 2